MAWCLPSPPKQQNPFAALQTSSHRASNTVPQSGHPETVNPPTGLQVFTFQPIIRIIVLFLSFPLSHHFAHT
jgi:hypothetical protein